MKQQQMQSEMPGVFVREQSDVIFTRLSWIHTNGEDQRKKSKLLFLQYRDHDELYEPGLIQLPRIHDKVALAQKIRVDLEVQLIPETIEFLFSFRAPVSGDKYPPDSMMETKCFGAEFKGKLHTTRRITKLHYLNLCDKHRTTESGRVLLDMVYPK